MKRIIKIIAFQIGVDCLGFPQFHKHLVEEFYEVKNYITVFHKKFHESKKRFSL